MAAWILNDQIQVYTLSVESSHGRTINFMCISSTLRVSVILIQILLIGASILRKIKVIYMLLKENCKHDCVCKGKGDMA